MAEQDNERQVRENERVREAKRALANAAQVEGVGRSSLADQARRARDHMAAGDADPDDMVEKWATRIGRGLGALFAVALLIYLIGTYVI